MKDIVCFSLPGNEILTEQLSIKMDADIGNHIVSKFPDQETYVRVVTDVQDKAVVLICTLYEPNEKILPIYFLSRTAKSLGAKKVLLVAPYLAYMRQDKEFHKGEGLTSQYFGELMSTVVDAIITIDPHLHRITSLSEHYRIPNAVVHSGVEISRWIKDYINNPIIIGPDTESKQWVSDIALAVGVPHVVLGKIRHSANTVEIRLPEMVRYKNKVPVVVDDIISTAHTMIETVKHLKRAGMKPPVCIGIHAIFSGSSYQELLDCGVHSVVTCNTVRHPSNAIDLTNILASQITEMISNLT
ncbi:ribose-phosphate diphosphokinase [Aestuariivivens sediminis]|uniref:ribose-phosphate diphosphokinase n=1 Tax=Aestuariivivens sediminis TaxID=2913557 RepID=UPI001F583AFB|nr:ribose-phosphate diphosphokinase [Aestuariivivens sediminis]